MKKRLVYLILALAAASFMLQGCERKNSSGHVQDRGEISVDADSSSAADAELASESEEKKSEIEAEEAPVTTGREGESGQTAGDNTQPEEIPAIEPETVSAGQTTQESGEPADNETTMMTGF
ncbi:MAG: hypothetical protein IJH99_06925 [Eubacterium sp.]|nr:hypothetical protein [Eubacterium sp.]